MVMGPKVKGILKTFNKCFNKPEEKQELQIGLPTDVKHVAHIGADDANTTKPSWMEDYKEAPEVAPQDSQEGENQKASKSKRHHHKHRDKESGTRHRPMRSKDAGEEGDSASGSSKQHRRRKSKRSKAQQDSDPQFQENMLTA